MVTRELQKAIAELPRAKDGARGEDGRDAYALDPLESIDETRSYSRGTVACYDGGLIRAMRQTDPLKGSDLSKSGWMVLMRGVAQDDEMPGDRPGTYIVTKRLTGEAPRVYIRRTLSYEGIWADGKDYYRGNFVTWGGSVWHCQAELTKSKPGEPDNPDWTLAAKRGADGKNFDPNGNGKLKVQPISLR